MTSRQGIERSGLRRAARVLGLMVLLVGTASAASAQEPVRDTVPGDTVVYEGEELVVRALRTPLAVEALPYAVTIRRPGDAVPTADRSLDTHLRGVPGLQVQARHNDALGDRIVMRGFGARSQFGVRGIHVLVDGVPATMPDGQTTLSHLDLSLLERAEILRGPAAAAYGNAAGGVLLLTTASPPPVPFRQEAAATLGGGNLVRLRSTTGGSSGSLGWIATISRETRDGFRPHSGTERYQLTSRGGTPLAGGFLHAVAHGVLYDADNPGSLTLEQFLEEPQQAQGYNVAQGTGEEGRHGQVGLVWERSLGNARLEAVGYGLARSLENPIPPAIIDLDRQAAGAKFLVHRQSPDLSGFGWAAGLDAAVQADDRLNFQNVDGAPGDLTLDQDERVRTLAAHGQLMAPVSERVGVLVAARYDHVAFSADDRFTAGGDPDDSGSRSMDAFSPTAGIRLELSPDVSLFGNVATAFETPTTTELVNRPEGAGGFNPELEPQRTVSYELGARAALAPRLRLEGTVYHAEVDDALIPFEVATAPGRQYFRNAGQAVHRGLELMAEWSVQRFDLLAAYSRTDAEFSDYATEDGAFGGNDVPGVRPWTVEARVTARGLGPLSAALDYQATGDMAVNDANTAWAPGYHLVSVRAAAPRLRFGRWEAAPYAGVDNLLDETYVASVVPNAFGDRFFEPGPGRAFYLGVELAVAAAGDSR